MQEGLVAIARRRMAEGIERLELHGLVGVRIDAHHIVDREYLGSGAAADVRDHLVVVTRVLEKNRLGDMRVEIDDGYAVSAEGPGSDSGLENLAALAALERGDQKNHFRPVPKARGAESVQATQLKEQEFLRETEVLQNQTIPYEGTSGVREHALVAGESDGPQRLRSERNRLHLRFRSGVANDDARTVVAEQLVQGVGDIAFAAEIETQGGHGDLMKAEFAGALELQPYGADGFGRLDRRLQAVRCCPFGGGDG